MLYAQETRSPCCVARICFPLAGAVLFGLIASASLVFAQTASVVTNLAQLTQALNGTNRIVSDLQLEATVFACDTNSGALIVQDASGAGFLEMENLRRELRPGDIIRIDSRSCLLCSSDLGISIAAAPLLDNDGLHAARTVSREYALRAGRYPVRLDWFNQYSGFGLEVACVPTNSATPSSAGSPAESTNLFQVVRAECFQGCWYKLPNFRLLQPVKVGGTTNFDLGFRTRDEMVGIRFEGYLDAPRTGDYLFSLRSDDGSRLWLEDPEVPVRKLGATARPPAPPAVIGESMPGLNDRRLVTIEGRVNFASHAGKGLRLEMRSEQNSMSVAVADAGSLEPAALLNAYVRVSGLAKGVLTENQRVVLGQLAVASYREMTIVYNPPGRGPLPSVLTTVMQVQGLSSEDAARQLPVAIRGVVTAVGQPRDRWMAIQDDTRGTFVRLTLVSNCIPSIGQLWSIAGYTQPGDFAPIIMAQQAKLLGTGRMPEPAHPNRDQLANGSMDVQWVELHGLVTGVESNTLSLLLPEGPQEIELPEWGEAELKPFDKAVVRIRGALFAAWDPETHEVHVGSARMHNSAITMDKPPPADPFDAPEKTPRGLFRFDAKATPFQRVKVRGQVTFADAKRIFIQRETGIQILPTARVRLHLGDVVEAVGYPEISGVTPLLREAIVRKTGEGVPPEAVPISDSELGDERLVSRRIRIEGHLAGQYIEEATLVLQIQTQSRLLLARVANAASLRPLRLGSKLALTGVYVSGARNGVSGGDASRFELFVNGPGDIALLSEPSWWTLGRLFAIMGVLLLTLALAAGWITQLRRQVSQRTRQLQREIREREHAERQRALEAERSRIARDLHDDLGSSLTEINVLASTGQRPRSREGSHPALFKAIADKSRSLIAALDVIVWAVDPEDNSLQSLADYLSGYTRDYLSNSAIACRFKIPVTLPDVKLDGEIRHELLMVVKETLNNIVRHADATEVEFQMNLLEEGLEITVVDNGKGFDPATEAGGHGLRNHSARLEKVGGSCHIESCANLGTTVCIRLPLSTTVVGADREVNTTFG